MALTCEIIFCSAKVYFQGQLRGRLHELHTAGMLCVHEINSCMYVMCVHTINSCMYVSRLIFVCHVCARTRHHRYVTCARNRLVYVGHVCEHN